MDSNQKIGRIAGVLLLFVFISGIIIFQILQGAVLFSSNFLTAASENANQIVGSVVLGIFSGIVSIVIAVLLLPIFKRYNYTLAYLYVAFCILNFIAIMIDNVSVVSMLELSKVYLENGNDSSFKILEALVYEKHWWTHFFYLLISCFPVFVLYLSLYVSKLVPRIISAFGLVAVLIMFAEEMLSFFDQGLGMNMLLPIAIIQLFLPLWLIYKGLNSSRLE